MSPHNVADRYVYFQEVKRVVVKIGSNVLTASHGLNIPIIESISRQIHQLIQSNYEVILITSGAMASGVKKIGLDRRPDEIPKRQAVAAVGQAGLILEYEKAFSQYGIKVAQVLLTGDDLRNRTRYLNARNTLNTLLSWKVIPIINENDTVAIDEIKFGDNDNLAAMITLLLDAHILINLTDIDGLYDRDPRTNSDARFIPIVSSISKTIEKQATGIPGALGTGGMLTKIIAARKLTSSGIPMVIANGFKENILLRLFQHEPLGTFFIPKTQKLCCKKRWIGFTLKPKGKLFIDAGAQQAILNGGKSLLPSGILHIEGEFDMGAPVEFSVADGQVIGIGLVNYSSQEIEKIKGLKSSEIISVLGSKPYDEIVHRDNLVIMVDT
ncbi:MAG: glutamate 5-kinase [Desulfobacterales bacterium]|nr:glutamate 5-kinase [Desulfobacterales bacterium]